MTRHRSFGALSSSHGVMTANLEEAISTALTLKKEQLLVISKLVEKRDVFAELPTGFGKSLIYQVLPGVCKALRLQGESWPEHPIVFLVCLLNSIMKEQVEFLRKFFSGLRHSFLQLGERTHASGFSCLTLFHIPDRYPMRASLVFYHPLPSMKLMAIKMKRPRKTIFDLFNRILFS